MLGASLVKMFSLFVTVCTDICFRFSKPAKKIPMNALEKSSPNHEAPSDSGTILDLDFFTKKLELQTPTPDLTVVTSTDDVMVDISTDVVPNTSSNNNNNLDSPLDNILDLGPPLDNAKSEEPQAETKEHFIEKKDKKSDVKPLTDINVTLQSVQPSKVPPTTAFEEEEGLTVVLHFCKDKPRGDVNVIVISTTSKSSSPIEDYKFQAVVPKVI